MTHHATGASTQPQTPVLGDLTSVPGPSPEVEAQRRKTLRAHKRFATGLLFVAAAIFLSCQWYASVTDPTPAWVGFVRAAAEAGMVGGIADWFAVTALFRHPLGIPIPHTAIVRRKKDQVGEALSGFVSENFLNAELITQKVRQADLPTKAANWLANPTNAEKVSAQTGKLVGNAVQAMDPADAESFIRAGLIDKLAAPQWGPPLGKVVQELIDEGHAEPIVDELIAWMHRKAVGSEAKIIELLDQRAPSWAPKFVNELVGDKVYRELITWTSAVNTNPDHEARQAIRRFLDKFASDLQNDPTMIAKVEDIKADVMASKPLQNAASTMWAKVSAEIVGQATDPASLLLTRVTQFAQQWGERLQHDEELRADVDRRLSKTAAFLANNYAGEVTSIIGETIQRWDADEASDKIELMVGKDLQYIRLNGTIVGAIAGLVIYTVSFVLFGGHP